MYAPRLNQPKSPLTCIFCKLIHLDSVQITFEDQGHRSYFTVTEGQNVATVVDAVLVTFRVSRRPREMYYGHARLCVCLSVCVSVRGRMPTLLHGPRCNLGEW